MARVRTEDLGRLAVLADNLLDHEIFTENRSIIKDDIISWFMKKDQEEKEAFLVGIASGIDRIEDALLEMREIARGEDDLNLAEGE